MSINYELKCIPKLKFLYEVDLSEKERNNIIAVYFEHLSNNELEKADAYIDQVKRDLTSEPEEECNFAKELFDKIINKGE